MIIIVVVIVTLVNSDSTDTMPNSFRIKWKKPLLTGDRIFGFRLAYGLNLDFFGHEISKKMERSGTL